ncbi:urokinase plasminogen activator surface receptor-like [Halichoeres trimaculatus]|uniref:urokinase plasminogen activator surface receptor-like n=1 Tax=Halichoeres trimaculatus TaxID=147232 RepID=UPI003D9E0D0C
MKLTLCVPLIWMLFSSAEALNCVQDSHRSNKQSSRFPAPCNSSDVQCLTSAVQVYVDDVLHLDNTRRSCAPSSLCSEDNQLFSISYSSFKLTSSLQCCSTDGCNNIPVPYPDDQKPNGLQCVTSDAWGLPQNQTLDCVGIQDRCIAFKETERGEMLIRRGCASANLCEGPTELKLRALFDQSIHGDEERFSAPECCDTSLCNSAPSDKLNVIPLLLALVALSVC